MNRFRDDDDGQSDGDSVVGDWASPFAMSPGEQPWVRQALVPWHMWGNSQTIQVESGAFGTLASVTNQLTAIRYARPETWHWLFVAKLVSVDPAPGGVQVVDLLLDFELIVGIGRSSSSIEQPDPTGPATSFERYRWQFGGAPPSLIGRQIWSNTVFAPNRDQTAGAPAVVNEISEIVGQDIQLRAKVSPGINNNYVYTAQIEVAAYWAPKTHIRPDWFQERVPKESKFPGGEVGGR